MTNSPIPHYTIFQRVVKEGGFVYEVLPLGKVRHNGLFDELTCDQVKVVKFIGNAQGICLRALKTWKDKKSLFLPGSGVEAKRARWIWDKKSKA